MKSVHVLKALGGGGVFVLACGYVFWSCSQPDLSEALFSAESDRDYSRMELLLKIGADPNCKFKDSSVPLDQAAESGDARAVAILVNHGAAIGLMDPHHQRLLQVPAFLVKLKAEGWDIAPPK